jgi:CrcB protein
MANLLWIALAGGFGAVLRHLLAAALQRAPVADGAWPWGTLAVNVVGCLAVGALGALFSGLSQVRDEVRLALFVGLLGGFTTYSAFGWDAFVLLSRGHVAKAAGYVLATTALGLLAVWVGYRAVSRFALSG